MWRRALSFPLLTGFLLTEAAGLMAFTGGRAYPVWAALAIPAYLLRGLLLRYFPNYLSYLAATAALVAGVDWMIDRATRLPPHR